MLLKSPVGNLISLPFAQPSVGCLGVQVFRLETNGCEKPLQVSKKGGSPFPLDPPWIPDGEWGNPSS